MEIEQTQNLAERIALLLQENEKENDDFSFVRASLEKINQRLDKIESQISPQNYDFQNSPPSLIYHIIRAGKNISILKNLPMKSSTNSCKTKRLARMNQRASLAIIARCAVRADFSLFVHVVFAHRIRVADVRHFVSLLRQP